MDSRFAASHNLILFISEFNSILLKSFKLAIMFCYLHINLYDNIKFKAGINNIVYIDIRKRSGPRMDPRETPELVRFKHMTSSTQIACHTQYVHCIYNTIFPYIYVYSLYLDPSINFIFCLFFSV